MKKQISSHQFPGLHKSLGIDTSKLGCVMLDLKPLKNMYSVEVEGAGCSLYYAKNKDRFWIDGWVCDKNPHITLLYGLLETAKNYSKQIETLLAGIKIRTVEIEDIGYFDSPYPDEPYWCIVAHIKVDRRLKEANDRLKFLPHVDTFSGYKPHMTIAYWAKSQGEKNRDITIKSFKKLWVGKKLKVKETLNFGGNK